MNAEEKAFLENMDMMLLSGSMSEGFYDERTSTLIARFSRVSVSPDLWTDALLAAESGDQRKIYKAYARINNSDLPKHEKRWLLTVLCSGLPDTPEEQLRQLSVGNTNLPESGDDDCIQQSAAIMAAKLYDANEERKRIEMEQRTAAEKRVAKGIQRNVMENAQRLQEAQDDLNRHRSIDPNTYR